MNFLDHIKNARSSVANASAVTVFLAVALCGSLLGVASIVLEMMYQVGISMQNGGFTLIEYQQAVHAFELGKPELSLLFSLSGNDPEVTASMRGFSFVVMAFVAPAAAILKGFLPVVRSAILRTFAARAA